MISSPITLIKKAFEIYREKISTVTSLGFIVLLIGIFQLLSIRINSPLLFISSVISGIVVSYIVYVAMIRAISNPNQISLGALFEETQPKVLPAVAVSALMVLVVSGSFLFLLVPGIIAVVFLLFSMMSVVVDGKQKHEALLHSWSLVRGKWWQVFWRFATANIIIGFIGALIMFVLWLLGIGENPFVTFSGVEQNARVISFGQSVASQVVSNFFIVPMSVAFTFVLYKELKNLAVSEVSREERASTLAKIRFFTGAGVAFIIAGIFIFGFVMVRFLPSVVGFTHSPAAVFEAL